MIGLIPARKGSKRLENKNTRELHGKPLIAWAVEAALKSKSLEQVVVATDCDQIAEISKKYGAEVPFLRSEEDSTDHVPIGHTVVNFIKRMNLAYSSKIENVTIVQATCPFTTGADIDQCVKKFMTTGAGAVVSVSNKQTPIESVFEVVDGWLQNSIARRYSSDLFSSQQQAYGERVQINGAVVVANISKLEADPNYFYTCSKLGFIKIPISRSVDIDTEFDFEYAHWLYTNYLEDRLKT